MKQYTNLFQREPDFAEIKFAVANIQFNNLSLSKDGSAIEANPATHRIAEYIVGLLKQKLEEKGTTVSNKEVVLEENTIRKAMFDAWVAALERMEYMRGGGPISFNPPPDKFEFIDPYIQKHFPSPSSTVKEEGQLFIWNGIERDLDEVADLKEAKKYILDYMEDGEIHPDIECIKLFRQIGYVKVEETGEMKGDDPICTVDFVFNQESGTKI